jgi:hypothetical protein
MLARQGLIDAKPKSLLDELGIAVPSSNGNSTSTSAASSTRGKRKATRQAVQVPILPNTIFPILHIFVRFSCKYV